MANDPLLTDPWAVNLDTAKGIGLTSQDARHNLQALVMPASGNAYGVMSGVFPGGRTDPGTPNDLGVSPGGGMSVNVGAGAYCIARGGGLGAFLGALTGNKNLPIGASNPASPRIDYVVIRVREPGTDGQPDRSADVIVLPGVPASGPIGPNSSLTDGDYLLAAVTVRANTTSILATDISDRRAFVTARGGIRLAIPGDTRPGAYEGEYRDNLLFNQLERWSGIAWQAVATPAEWAEQTPALIAAGTGQQIGMGTGAIRKVRFQLVGRRLDFSFHFRWGTPPWNGMFGDVSTRLPVHPVTGATLLGANYPQWVQAQLYTDPRAGYQGSFSGLAKIHPESNIVQPYFFRHSGTDSNIAPYKIANSAGSKNTAVPRIYNPDGTPEGGDMQITGSVEVKF